MTEPTAVAVYAFVFSGMQEGATVVVLGLGYVGQIIARLARMGGAGTIYATDVNESRLELARGIVDESVDVNSVNAIDRILQLTGSRGADVVFECAGVVSTTQQSIALVRKGGTIVIVGL